MRILNRTKGTLLASQADLADTIISRLIGLLNRSSLSAQSALIITDCRSIHMLGMRFALDVVFADRDYRVVGIVKNIKPFCVSPYFYKAYYAIECPVGAAEQAQITIGDRLSVE